LFISKPDLALIPARQYYGHWHAYDDLILQQDRMPSVWIELAVPTFLSWLYIRHCFPHGSFELQFSESDEDIPKWIGSFAWGGGEVVEGRGTMIYIYVVVCTAASGRVDIIRGP
jgi:hypothetical protein